MHALMNADIQHSDVVRGQSILAECLFQILGRQTDRQTDRQRLRHSKQTQPLNVCVLARQTRQPTSSTDKHELTLLPCIIHNRITKTSLEVFHNRITNKPLGSCRQLDRDRRSFECGCSRSRCHPDPQRISHTSRSPRYRGNPCSRRQKEQQCCLRWHTRPQ